MEKLTNLIVTYIDFYRIDEDDKNFGTIFPFDQDAIEPAIEASRYYPRGALWYAYMILRKAAKDGIGPPITREFVEDFIKEGEKPPIEDEDALFQLPISSNDA